MRMEMEETVVPVKARKGRPRCGKIGYDGVKLERAPKTATGAWIPRRDDIWERILGRSAWANKKVRKRELKDPEKIRYYADLAMKAWILAHTS